MQINEIKIVKDINTQKKKGKKLAHMRPVGESSLLVEGVLDHVVLELAGHVDLAVVGVHHQVAGSSPLSHVVSGYLISIVEISSLIKEINSSEVNAGQNN